MATAQSIDEEWGKVKVSPMPALENVRIDPVLTMLLVLDFNKQTCNADRRPRCIATLPKVQKLLTEARAKHVFVIYSLSAGQVRPISLKKWHIGTGSRSSLQAPPSFSERTMNKY
jgi:nicotinamidase-related amidase